MSYDDIMALPPHLRPISNDTPSAAVARNEAAHVLCDELGPTTEASPETMLRLITKALFQAEIRGQVTAAQRFLVTGSEADAEVQRVLPLAKVLLESGMDIDTLLARMMGLE